MEIRHLRLIKTVSEEGSLTGAGKRLFLSQSALSHQLRELETQFETPMFQRLNKKMVLTQAGRRVLQAAEHVLCELEKTENDVRQYVSGDAGTLRISTECYTVYHWLPALLKSYHKTFKNINIDIVAEGTRHPKQYLLEGKLDVAIVSCLTEQDDSNTLKYTRLFNDELMVIVNAEHALAGKAKISAQDFSKEHLICYTAPMEVLDIFQRVLIPYGVTPARVSKIQLTEAIIEMVAANIGITVMAQWAAKPYLKSRKLVAIPLEAERLRRTWYAVTVNNDSMPKYVQCFIDHMQKHPIA